MEAVVATRNNTGHEVDLVELEAARSVRAKVLEVLQKAQARGDRHMTRERVAHECGAFGRAVQTVKVVIRRMADTGDIIERLNIDCGETTYHLPRPMTPQAHPGLFEKMVQGAAAEAPRGPASGFPCPYCKDVLNTERGRNIHIGQVHKGKALVTKGSVDAPAARAKAAAEDEEDDEDDPEEVASGELVPSVTSMAGLHRRFLETARRHGDNKTAEQVIAECGLTCKCYMPKRGC